MIISKKILSTVFSFVLTGISVSIPLTYAENQMNSTSVILYNTTNRIESKGESAEIALTETAEQTKTADNKVEAPFNVFDIYQAHQSYIAALDEPSLYRKANGIDVSQWQGNVDWNLVKESGVEFAIIRAGYGNLASQEDPMFRKNMNNAQAAGLNCGTYWYSYALSVEDAYLEAEACYEVIKDYDFNYPVYFDIEDYTQTFLSPAEISAIVEAFCSTLEAKGYYVGVYSYTNFLTTKIYPHVLEKYDVWVAHFDVESPDYCGEYGMWQYSSTGRINGISNDVDLNYSYINYPYLISPDTYVEPTTPPKPIVTTPAQPSIDRGLASGVDVSSDNGDIDWEKVANSGTDYAIICAGYGNSVENIDKNFEKNMNGAKNAGIDRGVYWYSCAQSVEDAYKEAEACYEIIKDYQLEYPIYYDMEDGSLFNLSIEENTAIAEAFCSYFESKGYYVAISSYANFLNQKLDPSIYDKYDVCVAHFNVYEPEFYYNFAMWMYSNSAMVNGISGSVKSTYCYLDFPTIMSENHLNGY